MRVAGIMSGTSLDGIDVAVVDIRGQSVRGRLLSHLPVSATSVREDLLAVSNTETHTAAYRAAEL